jgi:hypothetical protein
MPKFSVLLHGTGCRIEMGEGSRQNKPTIQALGFFTTRFVEAASAEEAARRAAEKVQEELSDLNQSVVPPKVSVETVVEDEAGYSKYAPGGGFTWYREDASH